VQRDLLVLVALRQGQGLPEHFLHPQREAGGSSRSALYQFLRAVQQMVEAALMAGFQKFVVGSQPIVNQPTLVIGPHQGSRLVKTAARQMVLRFTWS